MRSTRTEVINQLYTEFIVNQCDTRGGDEWADQVKLRVQAAVSVLLAAEAMYHGDCPPNIVASIILTKQVILECQE